MSDATHVIKSKTFVNGLDSALRAAKVRLKLDVLRFVSGGSLFAISEVQPFRYLRGTAFSLSQRYTALASVEFQNGPRR